jgi:hypothetical protein
MKHKNLTCLCCGSKSKHTRSVDVDNLENVILCNTCNMDLINHGEVRVNDEIVLRTKGYRGDFIRTVAEPEKKMNWFEREALAQHYSNMNTFH